MSWREKIVRGDVVGGGPWRDRLGKYLSWSASRWPRLADAITGLEAVRTREITVGQRTLLLQWNPARAVSSTAKVDAASIAARPCFLCPQNLPPEETGLAFGPDWVVLPNPAPILPLHLVVASLDHVMQDIMDALPAMIGLAEAADGAATAVYNGPRCGASAPDHLHFQVVAADVLPEERHVRAALSRGDTPGKLLLQRSGLTIWSAEGASRVILGLYGRRDPVERELVAAIELLRESAAPGEAEQEPLLNLVVTSREERIVALLFPRGAHRPAAFFAEGPEKRVISPGVIDMAGVVVAVRQDDHSALDGDAIAKIFDEVTLPRARQDTWLAALQQRWQ